MKRITISISGRGSSGRCAAESKIDFLRKGRVHLLRMDLKHGQNIAELQGSSSDALEKNSSSNVDIAHLVSSKKCRPRLVSRALFGKLSGTSTKTFTCRVNELTLAILVNEERIAKGAGGEAQF